jgi:hypothetical protein
MNILSKIIIIALGFINVSCGQKPSSAKTNATIKVTDIDGKPLSGIVVGGTYFDKLANIQGFGSAQNKSIVGTTNYIGLTQLFNETEGYQVFFGVREAKGFYKHYPVEFMYTSQSKGVWQPDNPLIEFKLKPIKNPIAMYAKRANLKIPFENEWLGFDFEKADWVNPHGKGQRADILFQLQSRFDTYYDQESKFQIKFPHPLDGVILLDIEPLQKGSILKMPYLAPEDGYVSQLEKSRLVDPKNPTHQTNVSDRNCYFLRVRCETDQNNKLVKANYVKIHNDFRYGIDGKIIKFLMMDYYYNPTPNDRNLEFDMTKNLFQNLKDDEKPLAP